MSFVDLAALTIHDVKNRLALMASRAEARGDADTLRGLLDAASTLSGLLAFYKAEHGRLGLEIDARCPDDLVNELVADVRRMGDIEVGATTGDAPALWFYDENLVRMVLANAVHNALRYARRRMSVSAAQQGDWLVFSVTDDGPGYPAAVLADESAELPLTRDGLGIGLQLARYVAGQHCNGGQAGRIELSNDPGAVFRLFLPK